MSNPPPDPSLIAFRQATSGLTLAVREVANASRIDRENAGNTPSPGSIARAEVRDQALLVPSANPPGVMDSCVFLAGTAMSAGEAHLRAWARLAESPDETFIWSAPIMLRGALEAFGMVSHLAESPLSRTARWARTMNELIRDAERTDKLVPAGTPSTVDARTEQASNMGLQLLGKSKTQFEEARPSQTAMVDGLFSEKAARKPYAYLSAFAHAAPSSALGTLRNAGRRSPETGLEIPYALTIEDVAFQSVLAYGGHRSAFLSLSDWCGWSTPVYDEASGHAMQSLAQWLPKLDSSTFDAT